MASLSGDRRGALADINVTPLVDVVLVLLIIFMVTAPMMTRGIDIDLPKAASASDATEDRIRLTVDAERRVYLNDEIVHIDLLQDRLRPLAASADRFVFLRADAAVPYGFVMRVIDQVKAAGLDKIGLVAEPAPRAPRARGGPAAPAG
jgi:biopolymer transport protein TolR